MRLLTLPDGTQRLELSDAEHGALATALMLTKAGGTQRVAGIEVAHFVEPDTTKAEHQPIT